MRLWRNLLLVIALAPEFFAAQAQRPAITTAEQFGAALTSAPSEQERRNLMAAHPQFVTGTLAESLRAEGAAWWQKGELPKALPLLEAAAQLARAARETTTLANTLNNIGAIRGTQGNYAEALQKFQQSLPLWEELKEEARAMDTLTNIGNVFRWQRDFEPALAAHRRVLAYGERAGDSRRIGVAAINIGYILVEQGALEAAGEHFIRAINVGNAIDPRAQTIALNGISDIRIKQNRFAEAAAFLSRALEAGKAANDPVSTAYTLAYMAWLDLRQKQYKDAIRHATESLALADRLSLRETIWRAAFTLGASHFAQNELEQAKLAYSRSIAAIEQMRDDLVGSEREQQRFFSDKMYPYQAMVELLIRQGKTAEALDYAERAKGRVLLDVARSGRARVQQAMTAEERAREEELRKALARASAEVQRLDIPGRTPGPQLTRALDERDQARIAYDRFQTELYARHPELRIKRGEMEWPGADAVAALIGHDVAVLEYVVADEQCHAILLTRGADGTPKLQSTVVPVGSELMWKNVVELRDKLNKRDAGFRKTAADLYDLLVRPLASRLNKTTTLIVVPDAALWELPFQSLYDGSRYMLESHTILYAPSMAVVAAMQKTQQPPVTSARLFAVGNPLTRKKALPNAEREVQRIAALHGQHRSRIFVRDQAVEAVIKREMLRHAILHFATHGDRDNRDPMHSHVLLAAPRSGDPEDGVLEARELMEVELAASLVILSACETAIGQVSGGEGMIGLTWALFIAGSPTTIASQWQVDSESTTNLMIAFHRNLIAVPEALSSSTAAASALRRSALQLLRTPATAHPYYWAGFVTIGTRL